MLEPADTDEDTRCIQVTIRCEENSKEGAITDEEELTRTVIEDRGIINRRSPRVIPLPRVEDTPGIQNLDSTCYGICVLHILVFLMKFVFCFYC